MLGELLMTFQTKLGSKQSPVFELNCLFLITTVKMYSIVRFRTEKCLPFVVSFLCNMSMIILTLNDERRTAKAGKIKVTWYNQT